MREITNSARVLQFEDYDEGFDAKPNNQRKRQRQKSYDKRVFAQNLMWILLIFSLNMVYFVIDSVGFRYVIFLLVSLYAATAFVDWLRKDNND